MQIKKHPLYAGTTGARSKKMPDHYTKKAKRRTLDKDSLPSPAKYYSQQFPGLKIKSEWVKVRCCFHDDTNPSLGINLVQGHYKCFACDAKGGDIISFHMNRFGLSFQEAVTELEGWRYE